MTVVAFFRLCSHTELFKDYSRTHFIDRLFICHDGMVLTINGIILF